MTTLTVTTGQQYSKFTSSTTPPTVTVGQSVSGTTISTNNILSGTVSDSGTGVAAVEIFVNSNGRSTDIGQATLNGSNWTYTVNNLSPGTYTFYAVGFDRAGNSTAPIQTGPSETITTAAVPASPTPISVQPAPNPTPPTVTVGQSVSGTTISTNNILSGTVSDSGTGVAAVEIFVNSNGRSTDIGQATLNGSNWTYTVNNLSPGTYTFYAVGFDRAGNSTVPIQIGPSETVIATAPIAPAVITPSASTTNSALAGTPAITTAATSTVSATAFIKSIGINTHLDTGTSYKNTSTVISDVKYLGLSFVRDSMAAPGEATFFKNFAAATGVRFDVYLSLSGFSYDNQIAEMKSASGILASVEGINEGDASLSSMAYGGQAGYMAIAAAQTALFNAIKSDAATSGDAVIGPSYGDTSHFAIAPNTSAVSDAGNSHEYFGTGNPPGGGIGTFITQPALVSGSEPVVATEAGYYTGGSLAGSITAYQHSGVSELVQAKYDLTLLFEDWKAGIKTTYLYELMDEASDPLSTNSEDHFGLFNADGTPKLAATATHDLITTLADSGTARSDSLGYQIAGAPSTTSSLLLEKSYGVFDLAVWNNIRLADATTGAVVVNPAVPVTIALGQFVQSITEYDPLLGSNAVVTLSNVDHMSVSLPDHPVIFEITPYAPAPVSLQSFVLARTVGASQSTPNLASTLLANVTDTDLNALATLRITGVGTTNTRGSVSFNAASQSLVYTAPTYSPLSPTDSFTYTVADAQGRSVTGTVGITETAPANTLYGLVVGDRLNAPASGWTLVSLAAGEQLYGDSGVTFIGAADTKMYGGANDSFSAGDGSHVVGAGSNARITFGNGDNTLGLTGTGNVVLTGNGNNLLYKSLGSTSITMGDGNQAITAGGSDNVISIGVGTSTINVGNDGAAAGNERVTVGGGTNTINLGGAGDVLTVKGGTGNQIVALGGSATITVQADSNSIVAQGANSVVLALAGTNTVGTNGEGDTISLGSGHDTLWAGGNTNRINAGSGTGSITYVGRNDVVDLTHGTNTVYAQGSAATLILAAPGQTPAQIFGNVVLSGDTLDLRTALAGTNWDGRQSTLASYLSVSNAGTGSIIKIDADGAGAGPAASIAVLNDVGGLTYAGLLAHSIMS